MRGPAADAYYVPYGPVCQPNDCRTPWRWTDERLSLFRLSSSSVSILEAREEGVLCLTITERHLP